VTAQPHEYPTGVAVKRPAYPDDPFDYLALARDGLPKATRPADVIVVGAGMAGLVAAHELLRAGHRPLVLEATQRVGGRLYTMREPFAEGLWGEAGSMRIPKGHSATLHYVRDRFGLPTRLFPNVGLGDRGFYYIAGRRIPSWQVKDDPQFPANRIQALWAEKVAPLEARLVVAAEEDRTTEVWREIVATYRDMTLRDFLASGERPWSRMELDTFGLLGLGLGGYESMWGISALEIIRLFLCGWDENQYEIVGGSDQLPLALTRTPPPGTLETLEGRVVLGAEVVRIEHDDSGVTAFYRTPEGMRTARAEHLILTAPATVVGTTIDVSPPFSQAKRHAMQHLHYLQATKVFLQTRECFWHQRDAEGHVVAGTTITDQPVRAAYFQHEGFEGTSRGLVIASYTWEDHARRWSSLDPAQRVEVATRELVEVFPVMAEQVELGASIDWQHEPFARGAFTLMTPGQHDFHDDICRAEGRIHIAGEHASYAHGWVEGAVVSGLRAALEVAESVPAAEDVSPS